MTPDSALPSNAAPFRVLFGRDAGTQIDTITLSQNRSKLRGELDSFVADKHQAIVEVKAVLEKRRSDKDKARNTLNAHIGRGSPWRVHNPEADGVGGERIPCHLRPADLRHEFEVELEHEFLGPDFGLAAMPTPASHVHFVGPKSRQREG